MKTILVDAVDTLFVEGDGGFVVFEPLHELLESFPNRKIVLTGAVESDFKKYALDTSPYEVFTLRHDPEKTDQRYFELMLAHFGLEPSVVVYFEHNPAAVKTAQSAGIATHYYDSERRDLPALKTFLTEHL